MNVVFISPNFPLDFYNFCHRLKERGANVLGIGDAPYDTLPEHTKNSVTEYYKVNNLENYNEVSTACRFFNKKYGKIDWIESENEYWLETEAKLRSEFNVTSGTKYEDLYTMKYKSQMKDVYKSCGIPVARYILVDDYEETVQFVKLIGYPVIVKPDNGVGASNTYKLNNLSELNYFFSTKDPHIRYIMEEFICGHVETFDGITDANKNILISSSHVYLNSVMDTVNKHQDMAFYFQEFEGKDIEIIGKKAVEAFDTRSRFFHFEFFRLDEDKEGLGKKGDLIGLEVNMRAPGGCMLDMINYAYDVDVFTIWADMIIHNKCFYDINRKYFVIYVSRRNDTNYTHSIDEIYNKYGDKIMANMDIPKVFADAMGDKVLLLRTKCKDEVFEIVDFILKYPHKVNYFDKYMA
ncbi:ATP-grasp domain-containing protein [Terrisporobacter sp.]